jgi:hypothetical protein
MALNWPAWWIVPWLGSGASAEQLPRRRTDRN